MPLVPIAALDFMAGSLLAIGWSLLADISCLIRVERSGCGGFDGNWTGVAKSPSSPVTVPRECVDVLFARTQEIQKIHANVFAGLANAQKCQIFLKPLFS